MVDCSVIIPHYNQIDSLCLCLDKLALQKTENISFEVIVVDNGSDVNLNEILKNYEIQLFVQGNLKNPYACRNKGIQKAKGELLCFLDAKCQPDSNWLQSGYDFIHKCSYDLTGGVYEVKSDRTISSKVFPLMYLNTRKNVTHGYGITTGNMFVQKYVFDRLGLFKTLTVSGNDIAFSKEALDKDFRIGCSENSIVHYPSKNLKDLLSDIKKYGRGAMATGQKKWSALFSYLLPMRIITLSEGIRSRNFELSFSEKITLWFLIWYAKVHFALGMLSAKSMFKNGF